jgi:hypothetical protein
LDSNIWNNPGTDSKTEFVHFPADGKLNETSLEKFDVSDGYMTDTDNFKYLGSILHLTLSDDPQNQAPNFNQSANIKYTEISLSKEQKTYNHN